MVFFLAAVAVLFILGGGAGAIYGADMIRTETGATMALSGVAVTCAGFVLLALVMVIVELRRLRGSLGAAPAAMPPLPATVPAPSLPPVVIPAAGVEPEHDGTPEPATAAPEPAADAPEPRPPLTPPPVGKPHVVVETIEDPRRREPPPLSTPAPSVLPPRSAGPREPVEADAGTGRESLGQPPAEPPGEAQERGTLPRRRVEEGSEPESVSRPQDEDDRDETPKPPRAPVATYNSGANTYFMYADGTIEAETGRGRFRFASMTELRHYAETGEGGVRIDGEESA